MSNIALSISVWTPIGPAPIQSGGGLGGISGRIEAAAPDPGNPAVLYLASDNGGIWKNVSSPANWLPLTDGLPSPNFNGYHVLVVHPANPNLVLGAVSGPGAGILKSDNGGATWSLLANSQFDGQTIGSLAVHPTDPLTMYISVGGSGVWKSTDGGVTWTQLSSLQSSLSGGWVTDLIVARFDPATLYAGIVGNAGAKVAENGVYKSIDSGATWTQLGGGLPSGTVLGGLNPDGSNFGGSVRLESGTKPWIVYVTMLTNGLAASPPAINEVQRFNSSDGGVTWTPLASTPGSLENRPWHLLLAVDPSDDLHVFANDAYSLYESTDGGATWSHADAGTGYLSGGTNTFDWVNLSFDANDNAVATADQGAFLYQPGIKPFTSLVGNLQVSEFYTFTLDPKNPETAYAVGQDIFTETFSGTLLWNLIENLDECGKILVDAHNTNQLYFFNPKDMDNFVKSSNNGGATWTTIFSKSLLSSFFQTLYNTQAGGAGKSDYTFAYASQKAFVMDPSNPARLLVGADQVFETTNADAASPTWSAISNALAKDPTQPFIITLAIAPSDGATLYAATQDGHLWVTYNDGALWQARENGLSGTVVGLCIDPEDKNHAFAVAGNRVWRLSPAGLTWSDISGNLNGGYFGLKTVFVDWQSPLPILYVGTGRGVYISVNLGLSWTKFERGLPNTSVNDLQGLFYQIGGHRRLVLAAATYGRGAWEMLIRPWGVLTTAIASGGNFGQVCLGSFADEILTVNNVGPGRLKIFSITSTSSEFEPPSVLSYPLVIAPGASIDVVIRFQPGGPFGARSANLTLISDDPTSPHVVAVSGFAPAPRLTATIANSGDFGKVCLGSFVDESLILNNSGRCALAISDIASTLGDFQVASVASYNVTVAPGGFFPVPIRFAPTSIGSKSATISVFSDDPSSPTTILVRGDAPGGQLAVTGSTSFGGVNASCCADRTLSICNTGDCALHVTSVRFKQKNRHWKLLHNPFPAKLAPGSHLPIVIQYRASEKCARACELVIESDDPVTPVKFVEVVAYTIWDGCCKEDCDDCRKGCCDKHPACRQGYPCCDDDGDDDC